MGKFTSKGLFFLSILIVLSLTSFFLGLRFSADEKMPEEQANAEVPIWAAVERRTVDAGLTFQGKAMAANKEALITDIPESNNIVVSLGVEKGHTLSAGDMVGNVSGEQIFVLSGPLPLYRNLSEGDRGEDVLYLQKSLSSIGYSAGESGRIDQQTLDAVASLYRSENVYVPEEGIEEIKYSNFLALPEGKNLVLSTAQIGDTLSAENPLVTVETSDPYIEALVPVAHISEIAEGKVLDLSTSKGKGKATVISIGEFVAATDKESAGYKIILQANDNSLLVLDQIISLSSGSNQEETLAVPSNAVKEDSAGTYVLAEKLDTGETQRVDVLVLRTANGYSAIEGKLSEGTRVSLQ